MVQKIEIPVVANTSQAERAAEGLADAFNDVAASVGSIGGASQAAGRSFGDLLRRARETRSMLSREFKQPISAGDTTQFMRNFAGMQPKSSSLRGFNSERDWFVGHRSLFGDARRAEQHRRRVLTFGMQGTNFAANNFPAGGPDAPGGGGAGGWNWGRGEFQHGVGKARNAAFGFGKSVLALAGISSIMGMASRASDLGTEEATGIDTLKRRMGDLGVDFDKLRDRARSAGVTFVESQRLAQAYAREVGNLGAGDNLQGRLRTSMGFSRAYGLDPTEGNQFFGQMARLGVGRDEGGQRRLALLIGDAVAKSGYSGKVDELLSAVADYSQASARMILGAPNVGAYANALTSLTSRGLPGLDPAGAAALLGTADASMRRGGAMGDASLNFMYAAMRNASPGIKPVDALALMEGGLFGTTRSTFGPGSALSGMMGKGVGLNDDTNLEKVIPQFRKFYGNSGYMLDAVKNAFGLNSHAQASALVKLQDRGQLGASAALLGSAGIDPMAVGASGFATIGAIANTHGIGNLQNLAGTIGGRSDLAPAQRQKFAEAVAAAMKTGNEGAVRNAMATAVAGLYQEKTPGSDTRQAVVDLTDKLRIATLSEAVIESIEQIERLFGKAQIIEASDGVKVRAAERGLAKRAPFHKAKNSMGDSIIAETFADVVAAREQGDQLAFITHNTRDFSVEVGDLRQPHPDLEDLFADDAVTYSTGLAEVLNELQPDLLEEVRFELEWDGGTPRRLSELIATERELFYKVWYNRHLGLRNRVEEGKITVVSRREWEKHKDNSRFITREIWKGARAAAKQVEEEFGDDLGPWSDFEWGMINGKLSAIRWAMGEEWDMLDT